MNSESKTIPAACDGGMYQVFVYGTLKQGEPNYHVMSGEETGVSKFVGTARLLKKYPLIVSTEFNIPFLLNNPDVGQFVEGEVYEVDESKLAALDELENHPHFYVRTSQRVQLLESGKEIDAWVYLLPKWQETLVATGSTMLVSYNTNGDHGRPYVEKYLRDQKIEGSQHVLITTVRA